MKISKCIYAIGLVLILALAACSSTPAVTNAPAAPAAATNAPAAAAAPATNPAGGTCLGSAQNALVDLNCRKVSIALENAYLPFNYIVLSTNQPGGWDYEAWTEICTRLHCTPVFTESAWEGLIQSVSNKQYDVGADGITNTEDRQKIVDFSTGYMKINQRLLVRKGETRFTDIKDLASKPDLKIGTQTGTTNYETAAKLIPENRLKAFDQFPFAIQALISNDVDAVIIDEIAGMGYQGQNSDKLEFKGDSISSDELGFVFPKNSDLLSPVNKAIESMSKDGTLEKLNKKFFSADFKITSDEIKK
jgi:polar amino acid transport system substrate-binding protein